VARYKLRKGVAIGSLAAENDGMLSNVFVDAGYLERLSDASEGAFLILGRAGSGKTALILILFT
jgi:DNA helicase HerA-like ATPase